MNNRTVGIVATVITALCCGCTSLFLCLFAVVGMARGSVDLNGAPTEFPTAAGITMLCLSVFFIAIPLVVAFFTFRKKPATAPAAVPVAPVVPPDVTPEVTPGNDEPLPPAS